MIKTVSRLIAWPRLRHSDVNTTDVITMHVVMDSPLAAVPCAGCAASLASSWLRAAASWPPGGAGNCPGAAEHGDGAANGTAHNGMALDCVITFSRSLKNSLKKFKQAKHGYSNDAYCRVRFIPAPALTGGGPAGRQASSAPTGDGPAGRTPAVRPTSGVPDGRKAGAIGPGASGDGASGADDGDGVWMSNGGCRT